MHTRLMLALSALLSLHVAPFASRVLAEPPNTEAAPRASEGDEPAGYRETVEQALSEYAAKNYEEASSLFARAHALYPNARTLRGQGMTAFELRRYEESIGFLEGALRAGAKALDGQLRADTQALLVRAQSFVARVEVDLSPSSATLAIDGKPVPYTPRTPLLLGLGEHALSAEAEGYRPERKNVRVRGGEVLRIDLQLTASALEVTREQRPDQPRRLVKSPWLWTAVGAVVVGAAVAGVLLATRDDGGSRVVPNMVAGGGKQVEPLSALVFP
ncbi:MAG: hypothetical protein RLZZ450_259 [Pseudomonadota bacterium]